MEEILRRADLRRAPTGRTASRFPGLRRTERGAAYAEAVIFVGFLLVIWVSVVYVTRRSEARQLARLTARECAWVVAVGGCQELPAKCRDSGVTQAPPNSELRDQFLPLEDEVASAPADDADGVTAKARELIAAEVEGLLFERVTAQGSRTVKRSAPFGGGELQVSASYSLPCNSTPTTVGDQARRFFDVIVKRRF